LHRKLQPNGARIQRLFVLTAYGNIPSPYPTVPLSTHLGAPLPQNGVVKKIKFKTATKTMTDI